jgi:hypothetical protein
MEKEKAVRFGVFTLIATVQIIMTVLQEEEREDNRFSFILKAVCRHMRRLSVFKDVQFSSEKRNQRRKNKQTLTPRTT